MAMDDQTELERLRAEDAAMRAITNNPGPVPVADAIAVAETPLTAAHACSAGHACTCPDPGGHSCGREPEFEPDSPIAEELRRLAAVKAP